LAQSEPGPIAHLVSNIPVMPIVVMLVDGLGLLEAEADVSEELVSFYHVLGLYGPYRTVENHLQQLS
jgi:hypothetical protein